MKTIFVYSLFLLMLAAPHANATPHARSVSTKRKVRIHASIRRTHPSNKPTVRVIISETTGAIRGSRELIAELREAYPGYIGHLLNDPRFRFDMLSLTGPVPLLGYPPEWSNIHPKNYMLSDFAIRHCNQFLDKNSKQFDWIEKNQGVPRESIAAIQDAEHMCGAGFLGSHPVAQTLFTRALFARKAKHRKLSRSELFVFLGIAKRYEPLGMWRDPLGIKGSWAGAFGLTQDLPSAYARTAMRYEERDGKLECLPQIESATPPDVFDARDSICSVANYLAKTKRTGYRSFIRYNPSAPYARSCVMAAGKFQTKTNLARLRAAK